MCGIGGIVVVTPPGERHEPIPEAWLDALDAGIAWRGPDGAGRFRDVAERQDGATIEVALVHRRLSIIDHEGGAQPMTLAGGAQHGALIGPTGRIDDPLGLRPEGVAITDVRGWDDERKRGLIALVFNGCVYSNAALRDGLAARGVRFDTPRSDTEALVRWSAYGDAGLGDPVAMQASIEWRRDPPAILLRRDWAGEKPLFTATVGNSTVLASTPAAIALVRRARGEPAAALKRSSEIDRASADAWVRLGWSRTALNTQADAVPPGEHARAPTSRAGHTASEIDGALATAVADRLEADVPVGCFLSGGIDSSLIAYHAQRAMASRGEALRTLTVRMPDDRYDESAHAAAVAAHLGTEHHEIDVSPTPAEDLVWLIERMGVPFGDSSLLPTYWLCRAARDIVGVALAGDGGDELFFGYARYRAAAWLRGPMKWAIAALPRRVLGDGRDPTMSASKRDRLIEAARHRGYVELVSVFPTPLLRRLVRGSGRGNDPSTSDAQRDSWLRMTGGADRARAWDVSRYLAGDLLQKTDSASMAAGLEVRCPFLDPTLAGAALSLPRAAIMSGGRPKGVLRDLAARHLPAGIAERSKQGFAAPVGAWFRDGFGGMRDLLMDLVATPASGAGASDGGGPFGPLHDVLDIDNRYVLRLIDEHWRAGGLDGPMGTPGRHARDHSQRLYLLCALAVWGRWADRLKS